MKEYKVVYRTASETSFEGTVRQQLEQDINELALKGWEVKSFKINVVSEGDMPNYVSAYALLERDVVSN
jgi:hypothetical protein